MVILTIFQKRRKVAHSHFDKFSKKGGKCPTVILTNFHKEEENVPKTFSPILEKRRKMSYHHSDMFFQKEENVP